MSKEPASPLAHRLSRDAVRRCDLAVALAVRAVENDACTVLQRLRRLGPARPTLQRRAFFRGQDQRFEWPASSTSHLPTPLNVLREGIVFNVDVLPSRRGAGNPRRAATRAGRSGDVHPEERRRSEEGNCARQRSHRHGKRSAKTALKALMSELPHRRRPRASRRRAASVERRNFPRGLAAVTALDRVNPRARRGGRVHRGARRSTCASCSSPCSPASCIEADGAASVEISPEVSRP